MVRLTLANTGIPPSLGRLPNLKEFDLIRRESHASSGQGGDQALGGGVAGGGSDRGGGGGGVGGGGGGVPTLAFASDQSPTRGAQNDGGKQPDHSKGPVREGSSSSNPNNHAPTPPHGLSESLPQSLTLESPVFPDHKRL